jgi:hypothetical protein
MQTMMYAKTGRGPFIIAKAGIDYNQAIDHPLIIDF